MNTVTFVLGMSLLLLSGLMFRRLFDSPRSED